MNFWWRFQQATIISLILVKICPSLCNADSNQVYRPNPSLPKELNDFLLDVQNHRNDFKCIRYMTNNARRERKSPKAQFNNPINDVYPHMYKSNSRLQRQLRKEINVVPESTKGELKLTQEKYPNRLIRESLTNLKKRNVDIEIKENGKLIKKIHEDSNQPKSIILKLDEPSSEMLQNSELNNVSETDNENNDDSLTNNNKMEMSNQKFKLFPQNENEEEHDGYKYKKEPELKIIANENQQQILEPEKFASYNFNAFESGSHLPHKYSAKLYKNCKMNKKFKDNQKYNSGFEKVKGITIDDNSNYENMSKLRRDVDKSTNYDNDNILRDYSNKNLYSYRHNYDFIDDEVPNKMKSEKIQQKKSLTMHHKLHKNQKEKRNDVKTYVKLFGSNQVNEKQDNFDFEQTEAPSEESPVSIDQKSDMQGELLVGRLFNKKDQQQDDQTCNNNNNQYIFEHLKTRNLKEFKQFYNTFDNNENEYVYENQNYDRFKDEVQNVSATTVRIKSQAAEGDYNDEEDSFTPKEKSKKFNKVKKTSNEFANPPPTTTDNGVYDDGEDTHAFYNKNINGLAHFGKRGRISKKKISQNTTTVQEKLGKRSLDIEQDVDRLLEPLLKSVPHLKETVSVENPYLGSTSASENDKVRKIRKNEPDKDENCISSVQTTPTLDITDLMTCTTESNKKMKVELLINGKLPNEIVQHVLSIAQNTEKYKKFFNGAYKTRHSAMEFEEKTNNLNTCSLMNSISKVINKFLQSSSSACLLLADSTRKYLENILNVKTGTFTTESDIDENAEFDNHQNDMLFHKNSMQNHETTTDTEKCDNSYESLKAKIASLNGLVEKYNSMSQTCQQKAKSVKKYIDNHLDMLTNKLNSNNNAYNNGNSKENLINEQLQSIGLGKDQTFRPNFDVNSLVEDEMKPNNIENNKNNVASGTNEKKRQVSTRQSEEYKKLLDAVEERHQKRETYARIGQIFGQKGQQNGDDANKLESPLVLSLN